LIELLAFDYVSERSSQLSEDFDLFGSLFANCEGRRSQLCSLYLLLGRDHNCTHTFVNLY